MTRIQKKEENKMCQDCKKPYYITTAIAYASGKPHIGNTYEIVLADSIARYKEQRAMMYSSRPVRTSMDRRSRRRQRLQALRLRSL